MALCIVKIIGTNTRSCPLNGISIMENFRKATKFRSKYESVKREE
jgi:hypothetical protein